MRSDNGRETFYVSVGAGQILKDKGAGSYELEITANEEELYRLQELFEELASMEEAEVWHFVRHPYESASTDRLSMESGDLTARIYQTIYELGTPETRAFIEQAGILQ